MKYRILSLIAPLIAAAVLGPCPAAAQTLDQMIQNQIRLQQTGDQMAMSAAYAYYNYALQLRQMGYTGAIPTGVTTQSLNAANQALMQAGSNYYQSTQRNMNRSWDAITSTNNAITRGCTIVYWYGYRWICQ